MIDSLDVSNMFPQLLAAETEILDVNCYLPYFSANDGWKVRAMIVRGFNEERVMHKWNQCHLHGHMHCQHLHISNWPQCHPRLQIHAFLPLLFLSQSYNPSLEIWMNQYDHHRPALGHLLANDV